MTTPKKRLNIELDIDLYSLLVEQSGSLGMKVSHYIRTSLKRVTEYQRTQTEQLKQIAELKALALDGATEGSVLEKVLALRMQIVNRNDKWVYSCKAANTALEAIGVDTSGMDEDDLLIAYTRYFEGLEDNPGYKVRQTKEEHLIEHYEQKQSQHKNPAKNP